MAPLLSYAPSLTAAPAVQGISGQIGPKATITIQGTGFGTKTNAKPLYWADFENGLNPTALGRKATWDSVERTPEWTTVRAAGGTHSIRWDLGIATTTNNNPGLTLKNISASRLYIYAKRYHTRVTANNSKIYRFWYSDNWPTNNWYWGAPASGGGLAYANTDVRTLYYTLPPAGQWNTEETLYQDSTGPGAANGIIAQYLNGVLRSEAGVDHNYILRNGTYPNSYNNFAIENYCDGFPTGSWVYYDDIYMDDSWARVMIGNAPTFAASTQREIQIPSAWSDTSITVQLNQGALSGFDKAYLYVFDANGNVNSAGYPLCSNCPSAPSLSIN